MWIRHNSNNGGVRFSLSAVARFWETRRLFYNFVLTAIAIFWIAESWPHFRPALTLPALGKVMVLALLANVCYSAAYFADLVIQRLPSRLWPRYRWILWTVGTLFAILIESYWINDEIYPDIINAAAILRSFLPC